MAKVQQDGAKQPAVKKALWTNYSVIWRFHERLCGQTPLDPEMIANWLDARKPTVKPPGAKSIEQIQAEIAEGLASAELPEDIEERVSLGFRRSNGELVMSGHTIRAHFKDCARIVSKQFVGKVEGESTLGWKVTNGLYTVESLIPILRDGKPLRESDGVLEKAVHAMTPRGPRNSLKRFEYVQNVEMRFTLQVLCGIRRSDLETIMQYGAVHGYAGERSEQEGRYTFELSDAQ